MRTTIVILMALAGGSTGAAAQSVDTLDLAAVGTDPHWKIVGRTASLVDLKGKHALRLSEDSGMGIVWLNNYDFANGTIEIDVLGRSQPVQGSFVGLALRIVDRQTHDAVYFRPFNFRAADSTRHAHAVQYVSDPEWTWQRLRTERAGQYERAIVPEPDGDEWFHVRVEVQRPKIQVFVNGATTGLAGAGAAPDIDPARLSASPPPPPPGPASIIVPVPASSASTVPRPSRRGCTRRRQRAGRHAIVSPPSSRWRPRPSCSRRKAGRPRRIGGTMYSPRWRSSG